MQLSFTCQLSLDLMDHSIGTNGGLLDVLKDVKLFYDQHLPSQKKAFVL